MLEDRLAGDNSQGRDLHEIPEREWTKLRVLHLSSTMTHTTSLCCSLLSVWFLEYTDIINVDVYHKKKSTNSLHHFGVSSFIHGINNLNLHINDFLFSAFINRLDQFAFEKVWKKILETIEMFGFNVSHFIINLKAIITDFSTAQANAIEETTTSFLTNRHKYTDKTARDIIKKKLQGCKIHFRESVRRVKLLIDENEHKSLDDQIKKTERSTTISEKKQLFYEIEKKYSVLENWFKYWKKEGRLNLLFYEFNYHSRTNNCIESIHSTSQKRSTVVEQYCDLLEKKIKNFNLILQSIINNQSESYRKDYISYLQGKAFRKSLLQTTQGQNSNDETSRPPDKRKWLESSVQKKSTKIEKGDCSFKETLNYNKESPHVKNADTFSNSISTESSSTFLNNPQNEDEMVEKKIPHNNSFDMGEDSEFDEYGKNEENNEIWSFSKMLRYVNSGLYKPPSRRRKNNLIE